MSRALWSWAGIILLFVSVLIALPGDVEGLSPLSPGGTPVLYFQCDPDTDPECNLPEEDESGQPCDPATEPECNLPEEEQPTTPAEPNENPGERNEVGDRDGDGVLDPDDECVDVFGERPNGCPLDDDNPTNGVNASAILALEVLPGDRSADSVAELQFRCLVITEVLWAGTSFSRNHQYIELYNSCTETVPLTGATLSVLNTQNSPVVVATNIALEGEIAPLSFYLLVNNNLTVSNIRADLLASFVLGETNTSLVLTGADQVGISSANANADDGWFAGERLFNGTTLSMERNSLDPSELDNPNNWHSNDQSHRNGVDAVGDPINGTPRAANSPAPDNG